MTGEPRCEPDHPETWRGDLFTIVIAGPGKLRWGIIVRATDVDAARASVEARGHKVLSARQGPAMGPAASRLSLGLCIRCGYSLAHLPAGAAGEVMCPECGIVNIPAAPVEARLGALQRRRVRSRLWVYGIFAAIAAALFIIRALTL